MIYQPKPRLGMKLNKRHKLAKGLVGCWIFNERAGDTAFDLSGNGNDLTIAGADWGPGGLEFDGTSSYLTSSGVTNSMDPSNPWTINVRVKIDTLTDYPNYIGFCDENGTEYAFIGNDNSAPRRLKVVSAGKTPGNGSEILGDTVYDVVLVWNGIKFLAYLNGVLDYEVTPSSAIVWSTQDLFILGAKRDPGLGSYFDGFEYSASVYNRPLSPDEIAQLHSDPYVMFTRKASSSILHASIIEVVTNLLSGKIKIKNVNTDLLDGKVRIQDTVNGLTDGKVVVKGAVTGLADGKIRIKDVATNAVDGLLKIKGAVTTLLNGKVIIKDVTTVLIDGKLTVQDVDTNLFDGEIKIIEKVISLADGKLQIQDIITSQVDGKVQIQDTNIDLTDGKIQISDIDTDLVDGFINVKDTTTGFVNGLLGVKDSVIGLTDGKVQVQDSVADLADGKVIVTITGLDTGHADGKIQIKDITTGIVDGLINVKNNATGLIDGKVKISDICSNFVDGLIRIKDTTIGVMDGKVQIKNVTIGLIDGLVQVKNNIINTVDGKINIKNVITSLVDGKIKVKDVTTVITDGLIRIINSVSNFVDAKINITTGLITNLLDGKLIIRSISRSHKIDIVIGSPSKVFEQGETVPITTYTYDLDNNLMDQDNLTITINKLDGTEVVNALMTHTTTGTYFYKYKLDSNADLGVWTVRVESVNGIIKKIKNDFLKVISF